MDTPLLLAHQTRAQLRRKYESTDGILRDYWEHLLLLARKEPFWFSNYAVLAWLITDGEPYRTIARDLFLRFTATQPTALLCNEPQFHTHTFSAPLGRLAILYDWVAPLDLLSAAEQTAFRARLLEAACDTALDQLQGRARGFDNQVLANAFGAAAVGTVCGRQAAPAATARRLARAGSEWLLDQFGRLPRSCYSGEGSTYHMQVVEPVLLFAGLLLEETTGAAIYDRGLAPTYSPLREWLRTGCDLIGPGGVAPGWDAYGVFHVMVKCPLVYYALREGVDHPLQRLRDADLWRGMSSIAWEYDDRFWSLVWWPERALPEAPCPWQPWMQPEAAAAVHDGPQQSRLFQYWDETPGAPHCGRPNVNPNAIQFDYAGIPLLLDGYPGVPPEQLGVTPAQARAYVDPVILETLCQYQGVPATEANLDRAALQSLSGSLGESNSLVFDDECWYVPKRPCCGKGLALHAAGPLQVIESEAADIYADRYDVESVRRITALLDGHTVITRDRVQAATPHRITWQAFTWPGAVIQDGRICASPGGTVGLEILPLDEAAMNITPFAGTPRTPVNASDRIHVALPEGTAQADLAVCLSAQPRLVALDDISAGWTLQVGQNTREDVDLRTLYRDDETPSGMEMRLTRTYSHGAADAARWLRLRFALDVTTLHVNGTPVPPLDPPAAHGKVEFRLSAFPVVYELTPHLRPGENTLTLTTEHHRGESVFGPVEILHEAPQAQVTATKTGHDTYQISRGDLSAEVLLDNRGPRTWQSGTTDARHALKRNSLIALAGALQAEFASPFLQLQSTRPVDLAFDSGEDSVEFGALPADTRLRLESTEFLLLIEATTTALAVAARVARPTRLTIRTDRPVRYGDREAPPVAGTVAITLETPARADSPAPTSVEAVYALMEGIPPNINACLQAALSAPDWRVQVAAAEVAGLAMARDVGPLLLAQLKKEVARPHRRPLEHSWPNSKMNHALEPDADRTPDEEADPVEDVKRWRLERACVRALGLVGYREATPLLGRLLAEGRLFFPALAQVPLALARLDARDQLALLERLWDHAEANTRRHIRLAVQYLRGEIDRAMLEATANPG